MTEEPNKVSSLQEVIAETETNLDEAIKKYMYTLKVDESGHFDSDTPYLMLVLTPVIADAYCKLDDEVQRSQIDRLVSEALKNRPKPGPNPSKPESLKEIFHFESTLFKMVASELANRLRSKPDDREGVVSETREQLAPENLTPETEKMDTEPTIPPSLSFLFDGFRTPENDIDPSRKRDLRLLVERVYASGSEDDIAKLHALAQDDKVPEADRVALCKWIFKAIVPVGAPSTFRRTPDNKPGKKPRKPTLDELDGNFE